MKLKSNEEILQERWKSYCEHHSFQPGDLVTWKEGFQNKSLPKKGDCALIVQNIAPPIFETASEPQSPYFQEKMDVLLAVLDQDGDFLFFHYDKNRLRPATEEERETPGAVDLVEAFEKHSKAVEFQPGDLVTWKEGLKNKKYPEEEKSGVVMKVLKNPLRDPCKEPGSPYFREPLDMQVGVFCSLSEENPLSKTKNSGEMMERLKDSSSPDTLLELLGDLKSVLEGVVRDEEVIDSPQVQFFHYDSRRFCHSFKEESEIQEVCQSYWHQEDWQIGDLVTWKEGLKNKRLPRQDQCAVVVRILEFPLTASEESAGAPNYWEVLDVELGMVDKDGDFITFFYDSRRFRKYAEKNRTLQKALETYQEGHSFQVGDLVEWKGAMRNRSNPNPGNPAIVVRKLEVPLKDPCDEPGSPSFQEDLDLLLGSFDEDGDFSLYWHNSRRFGPSEKSDRKLQNALESYEKVHSFQSGDLVTWKEGLKYRKKPKEGRPAIVMEVLAKPIFDQNRKSDSPYFRENLDLLIGLLDDDGELVVYHYDSHRFEPCYGEAPALKEAYQTYFRSYAFEEGDLVTWKKDLKNKKRPGQNQVAIVVRVLGEPVLENGEDSGSPYFNERLDLCLGTLDSDGDFLIYHYDSRRFEPAERSDPDLTRLFESYKKKTSFQPGDLVTWKEAMKNRKYPFRRRAGMVVEYREKDPLIGPAKETSSSYFREKFDLAVGVLAEDEGFIVFWYDSNRFQKIDF